MVENARNVREGVLESRFGLGRLPRALSSMVIPRDRRSFWYLFGGLVLFFLMVQVVTGSLLALYYSPTPETANESVHFIVERVSFGWLIRTLHIWSSHLLIGTMIVHLFSVYFMRAYRKPREMTWISGILLLLLVLGFGFTGYLLPWDAVAYSGTQIGTEIPRTIPLIGNLLVTFLRGGEFVAAETLKRFHAFHLVVFPLMGMLILLFHVILVYVHGVSTLGGTPADRGVLPVYPHHLYRTLLAWIVGGGLLFALSMFFPAHIGPKADPLASPPPGIKPEWYFLPLYEALRLAPGEILGLAGERLVFLTLCAVGLFVTAVPMLDHRGESEPQGKLLRTLGVGLLSYMILSIIASSFT